MVFFFGLVCVFVGLGWIFVDVVGYYFFGVWGGWLVMLFFLLDVVFFGGGGCFCFRRGLWCM